MNSLTKDYSVAKELAKKKDPRWEVFKDEGNKALKSKEYEKSIKNYSDALFLTLPIQEK